MELGAALNLGEMQRYLNRVGDRWPLQVVMLGGARVDDARGAPPQRERGPEYVVVLVSRAFEGMPWLERVYQAASLWDGMEMGDGADVHCYTLEEFQRKRTNTPRVRAVAERGVLLYEDSDPLYPLPPDMPQANQDTDGGLLGFVALFATNAAADPKQYRLKATPENVQWGWLDPKEPPRLTIQSGDIVSIETMMHSMDQIQKGVSMEKIVELRKANPGGGPHSLTGPVAVNGAEPGDVLEIRILKIVPKKVATNFNLPGKDFPTIGALAKEFPDGYVRYFDIDPKAKTVQFKPGIEIPLKPFPGTLAVGIDPDDPSPRKGGAKDPLAPVSTLRPWKNGSNMDINEMTEGTTIYIPVFLKGGLIWTGDSHCAQGNGEVNLTALECSYDEIRLQPIVRKDLKLTWPRIETKTHYIQVGFDEDLYKAFVIAIGETVDFLVKQKGLNPYEAYSLASMTADCRVSQVVDVRKGVHCMIPKSIFTGKQTAAH